jgi:preprotein translocase subunit SecA
MLTKQIEKAQKRVEEQNFLIRKRVLEYDDVMNEQRRIVYAYRDEILEGRDMGGQGREEISKVLERLVDDYTASEFVEDWDLDGLVTAVNQVFPFEGDLHEAQGDGFDRAELVDKLTEQATAQYDLREEQLGAELMRALERYLLLQIIDDRWREHLYDMDYLREGIHLRGFAQIEPIVAYKNEAFDLFTDLMNTIWSDFSRMIYHVQVEVQSPEQQPQPPVVQQYRSSGSSTGGGRVSYSSGGGPVGASAITAAAAQAAGEQGESVSGGPQAVAEDLPPVVQQRHVDEVDQIGRNDPCWCGSGKKFKKCHGT